ncbi:homocysteine S-methyltransferase family protein [Nocardioides sp. Arc9.136]|uniref:homocysteine S-methyltransferase family protein n=1 Tax=Nocardioides sp. Arc9.136 TaxID=2996826 RepID=UPI002666B89E|nr:homocysteine S-methyltransferase family protein [Nocardioides sp. Arc9.136]WKN46561.1 homocysteine S-methyltransferase family protein [Nocardioides sp. Arc9.136]
MTAAAAELLGAQDWVTDGGLETDLLFNKGVDLPHFAAFPLVDDAAGRALLESYYAEYATIASTVDAGLLLETPTWRANPDWGRRVGYDSAALDAVNRRALGVVRTIAERAEVARVLLSGNVGPRGDGYVAGGTDPDEAAGYHSGQVRAFAEAGADLVHAMTMTGPAEALGVVRAARDAGIPVAISFTVETDGRLPDGTALGDAIAILDGDAPADWYGVNCAHPTHLQPALAQPPGHSPWTARVAAFRPNASTLSHAELDEMTGLDTGDLRLLTSSTGLVRRELPALRVLGGCCGTDASHVAALWGAGRAGSGERPMS